MPNPKRRHSNQRTRKRRTHDKLEPGTIVSCPNCHASRIPHRVCSECGYYNGRPVIRVKQKKAKKKAS